MPSRNSTNHTIQGSLRVPLRLIAILPFVLQIFAAVGLTGWLSWNSSQNAVNHLASQLMNEVTARVEQRVEQRVDALALTPDNFWFIDQVDSQSLGISPRVPTETQQTDLMLLELSRFLQSLKIPQLGQIAIIEGSGQIVASSSPDLPSIERAEGEERIQAIERRESLIREAIQYLQINHEAFSTINQSQQYTFRLNGDRHFLQVTPIAENRGLDWLLLLVVPQRIFMEPMNSHITITIFLGIGAVILAIFSGLIISNIISQPIRKLNKASGAIVQGKLEPIFGKISVKELAILTENIQSMAQKTNKKIQKLQADYQEVSEKLVKSHEVLEKQIYDRQIVEQQLHTSEKKMRAFFEAMNDIIIVLDTDGNLEVAPTNPSSLYAPDIDIIGLTIEYLFEAENFIQLQDKIKQVLKIKKTVNFDYRLNIELQERWFTARVSPMSENSVIWVARDISDRKEAELALHLAQQKSETLLLNILPKPIAEQLKQSTEAIADHFDAATILFSDIVGFTPLSARLSALDLVKLLNDMFSNFDRLAETYKLEKIKTIGDAYMVAAGLPLPRKDHAEAIAEMALDMQNTIHKFSKQKGEEFQIRIGIHSGPVVAGVIGKKKFIYDLWGDTVNVASRMESSGIPGQIQVTAETYELLQDRYIFEKRGQISVKGKGEMITYWLIDRK